MGEWVGRVCGLADLWGKARARLSMWNGRRVRFAFWRELWFDLVIAERGGPERQRGGGFGGCRIGLRFDLTLAAWPGRLDVSEAPRDNGAATVGLGPGGCASPSLRGVAGFGA